MLILNIGLFLLLGSCSMAAGKGLEPAVENFGGDIDSPNGSWLAKISSGVLWNAVQSNGFNN